MSGFPQSLLCRKMHEFRVILIYLCTALYFVSNVLAISVTNFPLDVLVKIKQRL